MKIGNVELRFDVSGLREARDQLARTAKAIGETMRGVRTTGADNVANGIDRVVGSANRAGAAIRKAFDASGGWRALGNDMRWVGARITNAGNSVLEFFRGVDQAITRFRARIIASVRTINAALRSMGGRALTGLVGSFRAAQTAAQGLIGVVRRLVGVLGLITGIGGIASLAGSFGLLTKSVRSAQEAIQEIQTMSKVLDMPVEELSAFMGFAAQFGVAADDVRQAFTQFYGVAGEARKGSGTQFEVFKSLGIDMTDAAYATKSMNDLLQVFAERVARLQGSAKTSVLTQIFGDDDATKVATLLDAMAKTDAAGYAKNVERMRKSGSLVTQADVDNSNRFRGAVDALKDAVRGLQLTAYRAFGRPFTFLILKAAEVITRYRHEIVNGLGRAWNTAIYFLNDFMKVFLQLDTLFGMKVDYLPTTFGWMYEAKNLFDSFVQNLKVLSNQVLYWADIIGLHMKRIFTPENMREWLRVTQMYLKDLWAIIQGRDEDLTTSAGKKLAAWRDTIVTGIQNMIGSIRDVVAGIAMVVAVSIDYLAWSWQQLLAGFGAADLSATTGTWYSLGFALQHVSEWINGLIEQLYNVFALGQQATGSFTWINDITGFVTDLVAHFQTAIGWFRAAYDMINGFFELFGWDLGGTLAFVALLRLSGIFGGLGLVLAGFKKAWLLFFGKEAPAPIKALRGFIGTTFKGLFASLLGLVGTFVAGFGQGMVGGLLAHFGTIGAAVTGLGAVLMRAFGPLGWFASIATLTYQLLDTQKAWLDPLVEKITGVEAGIKSAVSAANASLDRYGMKPGAANPAAMAIQQAAAPAYTSSGLNYITSGAGKPAQHDTFTFKLPGGTLFNGTAERSEIDRLKRSQHLSMAGA